MKTVVALFDGLLEARSAIDDLVDAGYMRDRISLVARDHDGTYADGLEVTEAADDAAEGAVVGALTGGALGGLTGVLVGLGALVIPGIGPVVAAGPIIAGLTGAGIGAMTGGILGALAGWGIPDEHAAYYAEGVRRGGSLVAVEAEDDRTNDVIAVLNRHNPVDIKRRSEFWRESGWEGYDPDAEMYSREQYRAELDRYDGFDLDDYNRYSSDFRRHFDTNYGDMDFGYDDYDPAYRFGYSLANNDRYDDYDSWDELEADARREWEQAKDTAEDAWDDFKGAVRYAWENVKDFFDGDDYDTFDSSFRRHYRDSYTASGNEYDWYEPGYRYGHYLATNDRYNRYNTWNELEAEAREEWEQAEDTAENAWGDFKDAVRYAWEEVKDAFNGDGYYGHTNAYRDHYTATYSNSGYGYRWYEPGYRYGYWLANDDRYSGYDTWEALENDARDEWNEFENDADRSWEDFKDSVRHGWLTVRNTII